MSVGRLKTAIAVLLAAMTAASGVVFAAAACPRDQRGPECCCCAAEASDRTPELGFQRAPCCSTAQKPQQGAPAEAPAGPVERTVLAPLLALAATQTLQLPQPPAVSSATPTTAAPRASGPPILLAKQSFLI